MRTVAFNSTSPTCLIGNPPPPRLGAVLAPYEQRTSVLGQVRKGLLVGLVTAALFCVWVSLVRFTGGDAAFARRGITYVGTMATYVFLGAASGAIIGAMMRFAESRAGAYLIGFLAAVPIVLGIMLQQAGVPWRWTQEDVTLTPVLLLVASLAIGSEIRRRNSPNAE